MLRRDALRTLLAAAAPARAGSLAVFFETSQGVALVVDIARRRLIAVHGAAAAAAGLAPPGSTLKPFVLAALLESRKLAPADPFLCPGRLTISGRSFHCSHPPLPGALRIPEALAYSCNCFVAHFAGRFAAGELAAHLERAGLATRTGWLGAGEIAGRIRPASGREATQLQALGEDGVLLTAAGLAAAYRTLALHAPPAIVEGLEGAVAFGTAQRAGVPGLPVAGKTGSVRTVRGAHLAWFAGFAPSRAPRVVVTVALQGRSGGADAAPVAGRILEAWRAGRL